MLPPPSPFLFNQCDAASLSKPNVNATCDTCVMTESALCSATTCDPTSTSCVCLDTTCGPTNSAGTCCGARSILDKSDQCCVPTSTTTRPTLDRHGSCCASGVLNACGLCATTTTAAAIVAANGQCCFSGKLDAGGQCCSGALDSFGVCNGTDASGALGVALRLGGLNSSFSLAALSNPSNPFRMALDFALRTHTAGRLHRNITTITVADYAVASARRASVVAPVAAAARALSSAFVADVVLAPDSTPILPAATLSSLLQGASSSNVLTVSGVVSTTPMAVCGNGVCESGERPAPGVAGCAADCPYPVVTCASTCNSGNSAGYCGASTVSGSTTGVCYCYGDKGYAGTSCTTCAAGFTKDASSSTCVRVQAASTVVPPPPAPASKNTTLYIVVGAAAGAGILIGVMFFVVVVRRRANAQRVKRISGVEDGSLGVVVQQNPAANAGEKRESMALAPAPQPEDVDVPNVTMSQLLRPSTDREKDRRTNAPGFSRVRATGDSTRNLSPSASSVPGTVSEVAAVAASNTLSPVNPLFTQNTIRNTTVRAGKTSP